MAGGGIMLSPREHGRLKMLDRWQVSRVLTVLDEDGWQAAQTLLHRLAEQNMADNSEKTGDTQ